MTVTVICLQIEQEKDFQIEEILRDFRYSQQNLRPQSYHKCQQNRHRHRDQRNCLGRQTFIASRVVILVHKGCHNWFSRKYDISDNHSNVQ